MQSECICAIEPGPLNLSELRRSLPVRPDCGAYASFEGIVRGTNQGRKVLRLEYEAYTPLAEKEMRRICEEAADRFDLAYIRVLHRIGTLEVGETTVFVQVLTRHQQAAFNGCRFIIDGLKAQAPIWKKEHYDDGTCTWTSRQLLGSEFQDGFN